MKHIISILKKHCPVSLRDSIIFLAAISVSSVFCILLQQLTTSDTHVPLIFVLTVLIIALVTNGYFYGILAALVSVFAVNWAFTYPYMKLDFSIYGYPLTFITMLAVSIAASMLATGLKEKDRYIRETEAEKMRSMLLRSVSHDLRTPLTTIGGSISAVLAASDPSDEACRELLENAKKDSEWMYRMVENLLSVTQLSGGLSIVKKLELVEEVIGEAAVTFEKAHPEVRLYIQCPEAPLFVPMDALLVKQVLMNLMENAVQHGKTTTVVTVFAEEVGNSVSVSVRDDGQGIDPSLLSRVFSGSLQIGDPKPGSGNRFMGLGLAVCRTIMTAHGGDISCRNLPRGGAEFTFTLPKGESLDHP